MIGFGSGTCRSGVFGKGRAICRQLHIVELQSLAVKIARSDNLPMLSQVASSALRLADDPNGSPRVLGRLIEQDPAIAAKVLRVANSAAYGNTHIASITGALSMLGMNTIRALVVAIAYQQAIAGKQQSMLFSKLDFWQHSLAVGIAARILGKIKMPSDAEELYLTGLIHDVGYLVLDRFEPEQLDICIKIARAAQLELHQAELKVLGFTHAEVGGLLAEKWGMAPAMVAPVAFHHRPMADTEHFAKTSIIAAADVLAHQCGYRNNSPATVTPDDSALTSIDLPAEQFDVIRNVIKAEVAKAHEAFQIR
jgi:HD-like signal output (HDOD) protein